MRMPKRVDARRHSKYGAVKTTVDGILFDSKAEARRYEELRLRMMAGEIEALQVHGRYPLTAHLLEKPHRIVVGDYVSDFDYLENGRLVVEDVKGVKTPLYRWKKKHFEAQYSIPIREITARSRRR